MKAIRIVMVLCILVLNGCAALDKANKWLENNRWTIERQERVEYRRIMRRLRWSELNNDVKPFGYYYRRYK